MWMWSPGRRAVETFWVVAWITFVLFVASPIVSTGSTTGPLPKVTVFSVPTPLNEPIWVAAAEGLFRKEGLDVTIRDFGSGATVLETFRTGEGDITTVGDLTSIIYWAQSNKNLRVFAAMLRDNNEAAVARTEIKTPQDLKGKTIGTRVGTTGSYFIDMYLKKNGLKPTDVTIKNLDPDALIAALDRGDIAAFFLFQPFPHRALEVSGSRVRVLTNSAGYHNNYGVLAARPKWIEDNRDTLLRFVRGAVQGKEYAGKNPGVIFKYASEKYKMSKAAVKATITGATRLMGIDPQFYKDIRAEAEWLIEKGTIKEKLNFKEYISLDAVKVANPKFAADPPE